MTKQILNYSRDTGFGTGLVVLQIKDSTKETVTASRKVKMDTENDTYDLDQSTIDKIKELIASYDKLFVSDEYETEEDYDLHTRINNFDIYNGDKKVEISVLNLRNLDDPKYERAHYLISLFNEIRKILVDKGVDEKYFKL